MLVPETGVYDVRNVLVTALGAACSHLLKSLQTSDYPELETLSQEVRDLAAYRARTSKGVHLLMRKCIVPDEWDLYCTDGEVTGEGVERLFARLDKLLHKSSTGKDRVRELENQVTDLEIRLHAADLQNQQLREALKKR